MGQKNTEDLNEFITISGPSSCSLQRTRRARCRSPCARSPKFEKGLECIFAIPVPPLLHRASVCCSLFIFHPMFYSRKGATHRRIGDVSREIAGMRDFDEGLQPANTSSNAVQLKEPNIR